MVSFILYAKIPDCLGHFERIVCNPPRSGSTSPHKPFGKTMVPGGFLRLGRSPVNFGTVLAWQKRASMAVAHAVSLRVSALKETIGADAQDPFR